MRALLVHLRLHFQLLLAPVFLWGWLVAGSGRLTLAIALAFLSLHLFLYSGATAFNSYYDRDTGPVGGLEHPPPVAPVLLPFSLLVQVVGLFLALLVNATFAVIYVLFFGLSVAYSHPRVRLKGQPLGSLVVVGIGQGTLAFCAAWAADRGDLVSALSLDGLLGAASATLLILALYPISQLYQVDEDAARGDRTVAVAWGPTRCFVFALTCTALGGLAMVGVIGRRFGALDLALVATGLMVQAGLLLVWARSYSPSDALATYRRVMRLNTLSASTLGAYLVARLALDVR